MIAAAMKSFFDLFRPKVLTLVFGVPFLAMLLWLFLGWFFFPSLQSSLQGILNYWQVDLELQGFGVFLLATILFILLLPLVYWTALILLSVLALPLIIRILKPQYPGALISQQSMGMITSWKIMLRVFLVAIPLYIFLLLLFWLPWVYAAGTFVLGAWVNSYFLSLEILSELVSREQMQQLMQKHRTSLWIMGFILMVLLGVPLIQLITPVFAGLWFTHWWLSTLQSENKNP